MSITFQADRGTEEGITLSNTNAYDLLAWLGYEPDYCGGLDKADLLARISERLAAPWNYDPEVPTTQEGNLISCGRAAGYCTARAMDLEEIARRAERVVRFG